MRLVKLLGIGVLAVGVVFVPWAVLYWLTRGELGLLSVVVLTISMPTLAWTACHYAGRVASARNVARLVPFFVFVGIWLAGPVIMIILAILSGNAVKRPDVVSVLLGLPFFALISAGYQGTFFGLLLASVVIWFPNAAWGDA